MGACPAGEGRLPGWIRRRPVRSPLLQILCQVLDPSPIRILSRQMFRVAGVLILYGQTLRVAGLWILSTQIYRLAEFWIVSTPTLGAFVRRFRKYYDS